MRKETTQKHKRAKWLCRLPSLQQTFNLTGLLETRHTTQNTDYTIGNLGQADFLDVSGDWIALVTCSLESRTELGNNKGQIVGEGIVGSHVSLNYLPSSSLLP